MKLHSVAV